MSKESHVEGRITSRRGYRCDIIELNEREYEIYNGVGWRIARFDAGVLVELFDPAAVRIPNGIRENVGRISNYQLQATMRWLQTAIGETWLVMCSCYELCEPRRIAVHDAASVARLARVIGDSCAQ